MLFIKLTTDAHTYRLSMEGIDGGTYWWSNQIVSEPRLHLTYPDAGGYIKPSYGSVTVSQDVFKDEWPPPERVELEVYWNDSGDDSVLQTLSGGTAFRTGITKTDVTYALWEKELGVELLAEGTNEQGDDVSIPRLFGSVAHFTPQRTGADTEYRYYKSGLVGIAGTDWHAYDDGVNVDGNVVDNGDTFTLSAAPVGQVSVTGSGAEKTLLEIFQWACGPAKLDITLDSTNIENSNIDIFVTSQNEIEKFLSEVSGWCNNVFWFSSDYSAMQINGRSTDNGTKVIDEFEFFAAPVKDSQPIKELKSKWNTTLAVSDNTGHHLDSDDHEVTVKINDIGEDISVTPYNRAESDVEAKLTTLSASWSLPGCAILMPLTDGAIPVPMEKVTFTDNATVLPLQISINVLKIEFLLKENKVRVSGPGTVTA